MKGLARQRRIRAAWMAAVSAALLIAPLVVPALAGVAMLLLVAIRFAVGMQESRKVAWLLCGPTFVVLAIIYSTGHGTEGVFFSAVALVIMAGAHLLIEPFRDAQRRADEANEALAEQALTDELTGLANRSHYLRELGRRLAVGDPLSVMVMDLNRFKTINDTLGHGSGDRVLRTVAQRLNELVEAPDLVARLGGDEFAVVSTRVTNERSARELAHKLGLGVSATMELSGMSISTTVSCGVVLAPRHGNDVDSLMRQADIAMYEAKRRGREVQIFNSKIEQTPLEELTLSASLKDALASDEFVLHYQPKVELTTGRLTGFEALARWQHPTLGLLSPDRFIHLVTLSDLGQAFADRIIELGVQFAVECRNRDHPVPVAVNLSARSLFDDTLPDRTADVLRRHRLDSSNLIIEITEADIMDKAGQSSRVLSRLSSLGVKISIDDFGTGYSSLARLVDLPISEVKIDRHFVSRATSDRREAVIVRSIVELAETLDLHIVAEGVEHAAEVALLLNAGCDEAQGYLFSPAVEQEQALELLDHVFTVAYRASGRAGALLRQGTD